MKCEINQADLEKILMSFLGMEESILTVHNKMIKHSEKMPLLDKLCGNWKCSSMKCEFLLYKEHASYKLLLIRDNGFLNETQIDTFLVKEDKDYPYILVNGDIQYLVYDPENDAIKFSPFEQYFKKKVEMEEPQIFVTSVK